MKNSPKFALPVVATVCLSLLFTAATTVAQNTPAQKAAGRPKLGQFYLSVRSGFMTTDYNRPEKTVLVTLSSPTGIRLTSATLDLDARKVVALVDEKTRFARTIDATGSVKLVFRQPDSDMVTTVECDVARFVGKSLDEGRVDLKGNIKNTTTGSFLEGAGVATASSGYILLRGERGPLIHLDDAEIRATPAEVPEKKPAPKKSAGATS